MPEIAVVDTSVLIALEKINLLDILCKLYEKIIVPEAVVNEFGTLTIDCHSARKVKSPLVRLRDKGFYVSDQLMDDISKFKTYG